jgi:hypothetical protein
VRMLSAMVGLYLAERKSSQCGSLIATLEVLSFPQVARGTRGLRGGLDRKLESCTGVHSRLGRSM